MTRAGKLKELISHLIKEAFIAGYMADSQYGELSREHAERAYQEWLEGDDR